MDTALLFLRLVVGLGLAAHGAQKLFGWFGGYGLVGTGGWMESIGFKPGKLFALAAGSSEFAGGLLLAVGLGGPIGATLIIATMIVAAFTVHLANGFFNQNQGYELPLLYLAVSVGLALIGFGGFSLDAAFGIRGIWTPAIDWAFVALGILGGLANLAVRRKPAAQPA